jgi:hypothetical protein
VKTTAVSALHVAVVAREHDDGVFALTRAVERVEDAPDAVVDQFDHPVVGGDLLPRVERVWVAGF